MSAAPVTTVYLVRHGATAGDRDRRFATDDMPLSAQGHAQAEKVAARLAREGTFHALYTSDLRRTYQTARAIGAALHLEPVPERALRELDLGEYKGRLLAELEAERPGWLAAWIEAGGRERMPGTGGEGVAQVHARVTAFFGDLRARHPGERVVVVSHGWTLAVLLAHVHDWDHHAAFAARRITLPNTAVSIVEVDATGAHCCTLLGDSAHLGDDELPPVR